MTTAEIRREIASDGAVVLRDDRGSFTFRRSPGVLEIVIEGVDRGQFGDAPLDEVAVALLKDRPLELFVDTTRASMPTVEVSRQWSRFFALNQKDLVRV